MNATLPSQTTRLPEAGASADLLHEARGLERSGCIPEAIERYESVTSRVTDDGREGAAIAEAARRLAKLCFQRGDIARARELCQRSLAVGAGIGNALLQGEAYNALGCMDLNSGSLDDARMNFAAALRLGGANLELRAMVEQNLGVVANIRGDLDEATNRYSLSLDAYTRGGNEHGCAIAYHNLGQVSADRGLWDDADAYFSRSFDIAERAGDVFLKAGSLVGCAKASLAGGRFDEARQTAEAALALYDQLGAKGDKSAAYRLIGIVYRETGRAALAESRLRSAIDLAVSTGSVLGQAEATKELAVLYQMMGRNQEALTLLHTSHSLFQRLDARRELFNVGRKVDDLESTYLAVVREWGQSIESSDSYTHGHCERVAEFAVAVASRLGLDEHTLKAVRLGAYLHDLGKVKVPHEILNKPGPLTRDEFEIVQMHPMWGIELLAGIEFPWDIKPIIRWHHEKADGSGYPDRLTGEEIPLAAQVVGIVDVYDALTTTRAYRPAMSSDEAIAEITRCRASWMPAVVDAFLDVVRETPLVPAESRPARAA